MDSYVINLRRRPDRLERVTRRFDDVGVSLKVFEAIDAMTLANEGDPGLVT